MHAVSMEEVKMLGRGSKYSRRPACYNACTGLSGHQTSVYQLLPQRSMSSGYGRYVKSIRLAVLHCQSSTTPHFDLRCPYTSRSLRMAHPNLL
jgi:hypothetical protein